MPPTQPAADPACQCSVAAGGSVPQPDPPPVELVQPRSPQAAAAVVGKKMEPRKYATKPVEHACSACGADAARQLQAAPDRSWDSVCNKKCCGPHRHKSPLEI